MQVSQEIRNKYKPVIGLEIHAQMLTNTKAFCTCSTNFHTPANTNVCPVCLGNPGVLPVLNSRLVDFIVRMGLSTNCSIRERSIFARKNYFYPDLSKGYQISQFDTPICYDGNVDIELKDGSIKKIGITRIHMEEDAGKSIHDFSDHETLVDFNRCGVPLIEIVSEPDINTLEEASLYLNKIKQILVYLEICDGNMEEGSLRCDANVSVMLKDAKELGTRTEIKNLNSFKNVTDAIEVEIERQIELTESGVKIGYQTMNYNAKDKKTTPLRSKEFAHDYRYFPEPDLVFVSVSEEEKDRIGKDLPEFPSEKRKRFMKEYSVSAGDSTVLVQSKDYASYFENVISGLKIKNEKNYNIASAWMNIEIGRILNEEKYDINKFPLKPEKISSLIDHIAVGNINKNSAQEVFNEMVATGKDASDIISDKNLIQVSDTSEIESIIKKVLTESQSEVERYKCGEKKLAGFFVGKIMKESKGKANPKVVNELLLKNLTEL
ncbi:Asp-tRNA(Asn)/Glu-tRNA(Gln) amidotransferase subunit GatB [soil metagenome]